MDRLEILSAAAAVGILLLVWIVPLVISLAVSRIFLRGWAVFFMAMIATGTALFGSALFFLASGIRFLGEESTFAPRSWELSVVVALIGAAAFAIPPCWLFVRWQRKEASRRAAGAFE